MLTWHFPMHTLLMYFLYQSVYNAKRQQWVYIAVFVDGNILMVPSIACHSKELVYNFTYSYIWCSSNSSSSDGDIQSIDDEMSWCSARNTAAQYLNRQKCFQPEEPSIMQILSSSFRWVLFQFIHFQIQ